MNASDLINKYVKFKPKLEEFRDGGFVPENNPYDRFRNNTRDNTSYINTNTQPRVLNTNEAKAQSEAFRLAEIQRQKDLKAVQDAEVKARMERMAKSEYAKTQPTTTENLAVIGDALGDKFRFSYEPNLFDDYLNPFVYLGDIAGGLANVPQDVKTGNYSTAASRIVNPLLMGAMAGYSSKLAGTGFVNELFNPGAGIGYGNKINEVGQFLTTQTPLKNAYKLNPYAFKPNSEAYYRGIGRTGLDDALESGVLRTANKTGNYGEDLYMTTDFNVAKGNYSRDQPYGKGDVWGDDWQMIQPEDSKSYIAEIPESALTNKNIVNNSSIVINKGSIPTNDVRLLKQDWLQGYKEIPKPNITSSADDVAKGFKSEIDWSKWNKEIPENKALMQSSNELPPPPNQIFIDGVPSFNLQRSGAKPKKNIYKKTESATENGLEIKTRYRGNKNAPADITVEGKSGYWQLRPNKSAGENTWYFSANMSNPLESGKAMLKINEKFPFPKPTILEPNNLSLDSYNNLLNIGKRKDWVATFENYIPLNYSSKNSKILEGLNIENTPNTSIFKTKKEAEEVVKRVNDFLPKKGIVQPARIFENRTTNTFGVEIPNFKLQRQYQNGGTIGNNGMFDMDNPNIYKAIAPIGLGAGLYSQQQTPEKMENGGTALSDLQKQNLSFLMQKIFGK